MREIKFRAWDKHKGKMVVVWDIGWKGWDYPESPINYVRCEDGDGTYDLLECSVEIMQYTGLKDKNGKEIYEGDILVLGNRKKGNEAYHSTPHVCQYHENRFTMRSIKYGTEVKEWLVFCLFEVVGNIHENPDLLKKD